MIQGPPGTGKSQTIVNVIADCMGRGESVLVVCEKKAALDIVQKRLAAEKLDHRVFRIENTQSDRATVLTKLSSQVPQVLDGRAAPGANALTRRKSIASQLDALEADLDGYHEALHVTDHRLGLSYRETLSLIARHDARAGALSAPALRVVLGPLAADELERVIGECAGLVEVWLAGGVSAAALEIFRPFAADAALASKIAGDLVTFHGADETRRLALGRRDEVAGGLRSISCPDPFALGQWLEENAAALQAVSINVFLRIGRWRGYFASGGDRREDAAAGRQRLIALIEALDRLSLPGPASLVHASVAGWSHEELHALSRAVTAFRAPPGLLSRLHLPNALRRRSVKRILSNRGVAAYTPACLAHAEAAQFESAVRASWRELNDIAGAFGERASCPADLRAIERAARALAADLDAFQDFAARIDEAPVPNIWRHVEDLIRDLQPPKASEHGSPLASLMTAFDGARAVAAANAAALSAARLLTPYLTGDANRGIEHAIEIGKPLPFAWKPVLAAAPSLAPFQTFRLRRAELTPAARAVFDCLAPMAGSLGGRGGGCARDARRVDASGGGKRVEGGDRDAASEAAAPSKSVRERR